MTEKMLIIDDEEIVLESCRKIFTAEGFDVVITTSPQEGLKLASDSSFDVIQCDWKLPGFDGMDVVEELDRRSPDSAVVMISGYPSVGRAAEAMKRGSMKALVFELIRDGEKTPDIIKEVLANYPDAKSGSIKSWCSKARKAVKAQNELDGME